MKTIGIIAEYNPFHNGHAYQIERIRQMTGADYIVIAMSGDFVQRGEPAILDKYARTRIALSCGANLVIELPALWAAASAESFAMAGVTLFDKMGCVDGLCFGAETNNLPLLTQVSDILAEEPDEYKKALSSYIKEGLNFPTARAKAMCDIYANTFAAASGITAGCSGTNAAQSGAISPEALHEILNNPNNILAIEYLKALKQRNSSIKPILLKREGAGYHETAVRGWDDALSEDTGAHSLQNLSAPTASATAIRRILLEDAEIPTPGLSQTSAAHTGAEGTMPPHALSSLEGTMPPHAFSVLADYLAENPAVQADDFSSILGYLPLTSTPEHLAAIGDCNADIANRLTNNRMNFHSFTEFCSANKSRDITYTRMSRVLLHMILNFTNDDYDRFSELDFIPYLRVLGFRKDSAGLFKSIKENAKVPLITKLADADRLLSDDALALLKKDIFAADLYEQMKKKTTPRSEYTREIVRL